MLLRSHEASVAERLYECNHSYLDSSVQKIKENGNGTGTGNEREKDSSNFYTKHSITLLHLHLRLHLRLLPLASTPPTLWSLSIRREPWALIRERRRRTGEVNWRARRGSIPAAVSARSSRKPRRRVGGRSVRSRMMTMSVPVPMPMFSARERRYRTREGRRSPGEGRRCTGKRKRG